MELLTLMERLEGTGLDLGAYWRLLVDDLDYDTFALFIAWDDTGLHGAVHMNAPTRLFPDRCHSLFAVTDKEMTRQTSRDLLATAEDYAREKGAWMYQIDTERNPRGFDRLYNLKEVGHILRKTL